MSAENPVEPNAAPFARSLADLLDQVRWDHDPDRADPSPLVSTEQFFRDFPWDGDGLQGSPTERRG